MTAVGADAYAAGLAAEASRFAAVHSELREGTDQILRVGSWALVPAAVLLAISQVRTAATLESAVRSSIAGVAAMIPEGLVLLTSVAFAAGVIRLGRRGALVQDLAAVEVLARVDVVCVDKTGTLTEGELSVASVSLVDGSDADDRLDLANAALGALANADPNPNATLAAIGEHQADPGWTVTDSVPFSSSRKWSAARFAGHGWWLLGAPEVLLPDAHPAVDSATDLADSGLRVVLLATSDDVGATPGQLEPVALVSLSERVRPEAAATIAYFGREGVAVKVISGDSPTTAAAVARAVGVPGADRPVDARTLPADGESLGRALEESTVFGRVQPRQKRAMVEALQARGHVVAMTGDGVNDVLALKRADLGVAMGSGSSASRAVAQVILLDDSFASLPSVLAEGRRVTANIERVACLFVTKSVYAFVLAVAVGIARLPFPFFPRHLTITSTLTIGVPAFFLALGPNTRRHRPGFVHRVVRFAAPAGVVAAAATFGTFAWAASMSHVPLVEQRTTALLVLFAVAGWVLVILSRPMNPLRVGLVAAMTAAFALILASRRMRTFFDLRLPSWPATLAASGITIVAVILLEISERGRPAT